MAHPALLADRPRSERGLTLTVLLQLATVIAIGAITFAAVHSAPGSVGDAQQPTIGQLGAQVLRAGSAGATASEPLDRDG